MEDAHDANTTNEVDRTSKYPRTTVSNHLIPFGFSEEVVLLKAKDNMMSVEGKSCSISVSYVFIANSYVSGIK